MSVIKSIRYTEYDVYRIKEMFDQYNIFIDNSFQRRYVWEEKHKIALIETILLGFDIPPIYLWQQEPDPDTGKTRYSVVDGQQRIGAIMSFLSNEFSLKKSGLIESSNRSWANKKFGELEDEYKKIIWSYKLKVEEIDRNVNIEQIKNIFLRLNITNKSLNPQELRNASFDGKFLKTAINISELDFWTKNSVFSKTDIRRMKDVEFVSHLLIFLRRCIKTNVTQAVINSMYDYYNDEYIESSEDFSIIESELNMIQRIFDMLDRDMVSKINKTTHIYTLFVVLYALSIDNSDAIDQMLLQRIADFYKLYFDNRTDNQYVSEYLSSVMDAVNSPRNREKRMYAVLGYISDASSLK